MFDKFLSTSETFTSRMKVYFFFLALQYNNVNEMRKLHSESGV